MSTTAHAVSEQSNDYRVLGTHPSATTASIK